MAYVHTAKEYATVAAFLVDLLANAVAAGWEVVNDFSTSAYPAMAPSTTYALGDIVSHPNTTLYPNALCICVAAGTTSSSVLTSAGGAIWNVSDFNGPDFFVVPKISAILRTKPSYSSPYGYVWIGSLSLAAAATNIAGFAFHFARFDPANPSVCLCPIYNFTGSANRVFNMPGYFTDICFTDTVMVVSCRDAPTTNNRFYMCGFPPAFFIGDTTRTTADVAAGSNVTIPVLDSSQYIVGKNYRWMASGGTWRECFRVVSIPNGTSIVADSILTNIPINSYVGSLPFCMFGSNYDSNGGQLNMVWEDTFTANKQINSNVAAVFTCGCNVTSAFAVNAYGVDSRVPIAPLAIAKDSYTYFGSFDDNIVAIAAGATGDVFGVGQTYRGSVGAWDGVGFVITDSNAAFTPGALVGKRVALTSGSGSGQTRRIVANTATTITLSGGFSPSCSTDTYYAVCSKTYRRMNTNISGSFISIKEGC